MKNNILLVDDEDLCRGAMRELLELHWQSSTCHFFEARNGAKAFELFQKHPFKLVITDLNMPVMNGYKLVEKIRLIDSYTPIVVMSGQLPAKKNFYQYAPIELVGKPYDIVKLMQVIQELLINSQKLFEDSKKIRKKSKKLIKQTKDNIDDYKKISEKIFNNLKRCNKGKNGDN